MVPPLGASPPGTSARIASELQRADALTAAFDEVGVASETRVGAFRFDFDEQRWEWSEPVQRMHGYQPGAVTPTTELMLSHKHPEDRD